MAKILAIGIATLDIINLVATYPTEDDEVRVLSQQQCRGGNATNTLTVLSQLDHDCHWAGVLIDEADSQVIKQDLHNSAIDISACVQLSQGKMPTSYITLNQATGSRTIVHHRDCPEFSFSDFQKLDLDGFDWLHFEGRNVSETLLILQYCKQHYPTLPCSVEIEKPRPGIEHLFAFADLLLFSQHYAQKKGFDSAISLLESLAINCLATCAWGSQGAWAITKNKQLINSLAFPPPHIIDTLGAGDTFNAAFIDALLNQHSEQYALNYACQLAGHKCGQQGLSHLIPSFKLQSLPL